MRVLVQNYSFNKSTKQVTFTDYGSISLEKVLVVTDVTNNTTVYQANDPAKGGSVSGNVLTLTYDTTGVNFSNSDKLQIFYEPDADVVSVSSSALPTGAATSAKQPALGTAGSASSDVITVQGVNGMTALKVDGSAVTQPVSGTVTANAGTGSFTVAQATAANLNATVTGAVAATQSGTWSINDVSGTVSLPTGAATSANQSTANSSLASIDGKTPALGQATKTGSVPVTVASDQTVPISEDRGAISTSNSTTAPLSGSATFTGTWEEVTQYASITTITKSDVAGTLYIEFSPDATNVDRILQVSDGTSGDVGIHAFIPVARYFRVRYVNGGSAQSYLRLQCLLNKTGRSALPVSRFNSSLTDYSDVLNTRSGIVGKYNSTPPTLTDGQRTDIQLDQNGRLVTSVVAGVKQTSTAAISAGGTFTSQTFDSINGQEFISWSIFSVTDMRVYIDESADGTNWAQIQADAIVANDGNDQVHKLSSRYARVRVINGTTANAGGISNLYIAIALSVFGVQPDVRLHDEFGSPITSDRSWGLRVRTPQDTDIFGAGVSHVRISQINANFSQPIGNNDVTQTLSGGGTTNVANGSVSISSGTATSAGAKLNTNTVIAYAPGREAYAMFTAAFTTPTSAATNQRIGLYDASNGFFIGYEGTSFGITQRTNNVDTFTARTSFNEDTLVGNTNSFFTRGGVPEAIDLTKKNVFRIRFGWLGAATIRFEVLSPDGRWVKFHAIRFPNTSVAPSVYSTALPITAEVNKSSADATNLTISSSSWDGGIVDAPNSDLDYTGTIAAASSAVTSNTRGKATISFSLSGTWSGTLVIQGHNGDSSWSSITGYTSAGAPVTSITANSFFFVNCAAYSQVRIFSSAWTSGTVTVQTTATTAPVSVFTQTEGNSAAGATDTGNPIKIGGLAKTAQPAAVTDGQRSNILTDKLGRVVVAPGHIRDLISRQYTQLTNTTTTAIVTAVAATFNDITSLIITNASNQSVNLTLADGATTVAIFNLAANGGLVFNPTVPLKQSAVNTAWNATLSATATVNVTVIAVQNI
jgi:hypothetical protein